MKALITGSSGYLGSILVEHLISKNIPVVGIDIRIPYKTPGDNFTFYRCCITDREYLEEIFRKEQPTHVIHFACTFNKVRNKKKEHFIDIGGSDNVLSISARTQSVKQLVYSSSAAAYGGCRDNPELITELHPLRPGNYRYGVNKRLIEESFTSSGIRNDLHVVILRICTVTGPAITSERVVLKILTKFPFIPKFCKFNKIQLLHEDDFLSLMALILHDDLIDGIYNMASDSYAFIYDLAPGKRYLVFPKGMIKAILWILWHLKILNLQPAGINNSFFPIILDPAKLANRYNYAYRYSTIESFKGTNN